MHILFTLKLKHKTYQAAKESTDQTLETMGLDYLDMMIIHSPQPWNKVNQSDDCKEDIESLLEVCEIKTMVNQILLHISNPPLDSIN